MPPQIVPWSLDVLNCRKSDSGASPRVASQHQWHWLHSKRNGSGVEVDVCSRWRMCVRQREAPASEITKSGWVAEYLIKSVPGSIRRPSLPLQKR